MVTVGNQHVQRSFVVADHRFCTQELSHGMRGATSYPVAPDSDEFVIELIWEPLQFQHGLQNPVRLTTNNFHVVAAPQTETVVPQAIFELEEPNLDLRLTVEVAVDGDQPWLRKRLTLRPNGTEPISLHRFTVDSLRLQGPAPHHGGFGQPLFCADWFAGVEHPASENRCGDGTVTCAHDGDGFLPVGSEAVSESVVWGAARPGHVRESFFEYVDQLRAQPVRRYVHYNSWYDLQGSDLNETNLLNCLSHLTRELHEGRHSRLAGFVIDDHWDNRSSVWAIDERKFPDGFHSLKRALETHGIDLGLWFGPVGGYQQERKERVAWYKAQGYEVSRNGEYLCLAGTYYQTAFLEQLRQKLTDYQFGYLKLDGMSFGCLDAAHGHPPELLARRALVQALVRVLETARVARPDIFLSITTGTWLSPWWLRWADAVFIGGHDYGWSHDLPSREDRDAAITYRDGVMYEDFQDHNDQFPLSSLMSVGIIKGNLNLLGGDDESSDAWRRELVMEFGRGIMQTELYISPQRLSAEEWDQLAQAIRWAEEHDQVLLHDGMMVLGDPRKGEIYGYLHRGIGQALIVLRNPSYYPQAVELPLAAWCEFVHAEPYVLWQLSPERRVLALDVAREAGAQRLYLQPFEVVILACRPQVECDGVAVTGIAYDGVGQDATWYVPHTVHETQLVASAPTTLYLDRVGNVQVGQGVTSIGVGEPRQLEERWGAVLRTSPGRRILEASWAFDASVVGAELVAVAEWQTLRRGPGWELSDARSGAPSLSIRTAPTGRWEIAAMTLPEQAGSIALVLPPAASHTSLWLWLQREIRTLAVRCADLSFVLPSLPSAMSGDRMRESHRLWEGT